jgi:hypothetical protein
MARPSSAQVIHIPFGKTFSGIFERFMASVTILLPIEKVQVREL